MYSLKNNEYTQQIHLTHFFIYKFISSKVHEYIQLLLYSNRSESGTLLTKKNILSVSRVPANKAKGGVPEESANFMLSNFELVPAVEVDYFLGTQGGSFGNGRMEKRLGFEEINVHWTGDSV